MPVGLVRSYTQTETLTYAQDSEIQGDIEKNGLITQIDFTAEITPSATMSAAYTIEGGPFRIFENLKVEGGGFTYLALPGEDGGLAGYMMKVINERDGFGPGHPTGAVAAPRAAATPVNLCYHMGSIPRMPSNPMVDNPFDLSAYIPAVKETQLKMIWTTSGNDVLDATVSITSAILRVTLHIVQGSPAAIQAEMVRQGLNPNVHMKPAWVTSIVPMTANFSDYNWDRDVTLGGFLKRLIVVAQDSTGIRPLVASDEITGIALKLPLTGQEYIKSYSHNFVVHGPLSSLAFADDGADFGGAAATGVYILDFRPYSQLHPLYGLDLRSQTTGSVKLGMTIENYNNGDDALILEERYQPIEAAKRVV